MSKRRRILSIGSASEGPHGDKPWVYFMVDCFFLITQFFLISFHMKDTGWSLARVVPPGGGQGVVHVLPTHDESLPVHLMQNGNQTSILFQKTTVDLPQLADSLRRVTNSGHTVRVTVSYDGDVPYQNVLNVMNECERVGIAKCSLVPLRADQAAPR